MQRFARELIEDTQRSLGGVSAEEAEFYLANTKKLTLAFQILRIAPDATEWEIKHAYRTLAMTYHPDHNSSKETALRFAQLRDAYELLVKLREIQKK